MISITLAEYIPEGGDEPWIRARGIPYAPDFNQAIKALPTEERKFCDGAWTYMSEHHPFVEDLVETLWDCEWKWEEEA